MTIKNKHVETIEYKGVVSSERRNSIHGIDRAL